MTFLERITYNVGKLMELSQYVLKEGYRVMALYKTSKLMNYYTQSPAMLSQAESTAKKALHDSEFLGSEKQLADLKGEGISEKDYQSLSKLLKFRDYVMCYFFVDNAEGLSREDPAIYESLIQELNESIENASKLLTSLAKAADLLRQGFLEPR